MTVGKYTQLFVNSAQAAAYAAHRPTYPQGLFAPIWQALGLTEPGATLPLALDVATGSGQALLPLVDRFERVVGIDASLEQIKGAPQLPNVSYVAGDAHKLPIEPGTADLITVGQALHWFDRPVFYRSAAQALKQGTGVLAILTYDAGHVQPAGGPVDTVYKRFFHEELGPYWAGPRKLVDDCYADIEPMAPEFFERQERHEVPNARELSLDELSGYAASWSAYATYRKQHPDLEDPILGFRRRLAAAAAEQGLDEAGGKLQLVTRCTLLLGLGPKHAPPAGHS